MGVSLCLAFFSSYFFLAPRKTNGLFHRFKISRLEIDNARAAIRHLQFYARGRRSHTRIHCLDTFYTCLYMLCNQGYQDLGGERAIVLVAA